jgi:hypothetical protein
MGRAVFHDGALAWIAGVGDHHAVASFRDDAVFRFESESLETARRELRRLAVAARDAGFELETARVEPEERPDTGGDPSSTPYGHSTRGSRERNR